MGYLNTLVEDWRKTILFTRPSTSLMPLSY